MAKTQTKTETVAEEAAAGNQPEETVNVPKEQFEQLMADMAQMKQQLAMVQAPDDRKQEQAQRDLEELERVRAANAYANELISYYADMGSIKGSKNLEVSINGEHYVIKRGETVMLPRKVVAVLENGKQQRERAYGIQEEKAAAFQREVKQLQQE